ncbi:unnamed protein product, partial [Ostreobium quekettii]
CKFGEESWQGLLCLHNLKRLEVQMEVGVLIWQSILAMSSLAKLEVLEISFPNEPTGPRHRNVTKGSASIEFPLKLREQSLRKMGRVQVAIPKQACQNWRGLEVLNSVKTYVLKRPCLVTLLSNLRQLDLSPMSKPPGSLAQLASLTRLSLWKTQSVSGLSAATGMHTLSICQPTTDAEDLDALDGLSALDTLFLAFCRLAKIPCEVTRLTALTKLMVVGNALGSLPPGEYILRLTHLYLAENQFSEIPGALAGAVRLEVLNVQDNKALQIGGSDVEVSLGLESLRMADLGGEEKEWDRVSVRNLVRLALQKGEGLELEV